MIVTTRSYIVFEAAPKVQLSGQVQAIWSNHLGQVCYRVNDQICNNPNILHSFRCGQHIAVIYQEQNVPNAETDVIQGRITGLGNGYGSPSRPFIMWERWSKTLGFWLQGWELQSLYAIVSLDEDEPVHPDSAIVHCPAIPPEPNLLHIYAQDLRH